MPVVSPLDRLVVYVRPYGPDPAPSEEKEPTLFRIIARSQSLPRDQQEARSFDEINRDQSRRGQSLRAMCELLGTDPADLNDAATGLLPVWAIYPAVGPPAMSVGGATSKGGASLQWTCLS